VESLSTPHVPPAHRRPARRAAPARRHAGLHDGLRPCHLERWASGRRPALGRSMSRPRPVTNNRQRQPRSHEGGGAAHASGLKKNSTTELRGFDYQAASELFNPSIHTVRAMQSRV
jgi:hypothetical protein